MAAFKIDHNDGPYGGARLTKVLVDSMAAQYSGYEGGCITVLRPDVSQASFSRVHGKGIVGPWAVSIDGNDNAWVTNLTT